MAYFIVIGANNNVQCVVDEMKNSHLQHNVITSGCIINRNDGLYYNWNVYNNCGEKVTDSSYSKPIELKDAFSNQIAQFKTLLPAYAKPYVFILCTCFDQDECKLLKMVCDELNHILGTTFTGIYADIVILGYDVNRYHDVTIRPHWRILESIKGLTIPSSVSTNILYVNNIDYNGAATNVDSALLGRFLCHWSKMVSAGGFDPKAGVNSVYSIGISEHQYQLSNLDDFFTLSAEKILESRKINSTPSPDTQHLIDSNDFSKINLGYHWLDGLAEIKKNWESYCSTEWDWGKPIDENPYSLIGQEYKLAAYLNKYLKVYIEAEKREIEIHRKNLTEKTTFKDTIGPTLGDDENLALDNEIAKLREEIEKHENNIRNNTFKDVTDFYGKMGETCDDDTCATHNEEIRQLIAYLRSSDGKTVIKNAIKRASDAATLPKDYPEATINNVGHAKCLGPESPIITTTTKDIPNESEEPKENTPQKLSFWGRIIAWFKSWFTSSDTLEDGSKSDDDAPKTETHEKLGATAAVPDIDHNSAIEKCIKALDKIDENRSWWNQLCNMIKVSERKISSCNKQMEEFRPKDHQRSKSLIDMDRVREFRDTDVDYKSLTEKFLSSYFDKENRKSISDLIKQHILEQLAKKYSTLKWDGLNPFVKDNLSDAEIGEYVNYNLKHSDVFVEYVNNSKDAITNNILQLFYSNNKNIDTDDPNKFRSRYSINSNSVSPNTHPDFVNSLCVAQVLNIPDHIDSVKDFKPRREYPLSSLTADLMGYLHEIVGAANTNENKARKIYDWICDNIQYDTSKQIYNADGCWEIRRGVCQAYCELFCHLAEKVGLTVEIITGKAKTSQGEIADEKHAWLFVYTGEYNGIFIDPTWGAGSVENGKFKKNSDTSTWFDVSPYWLVYSHFPDDVYWTKTGKISITEELFAKLPFRAPSRDNNGKDILFEDLAK